MTGSDVSEAALALARANGARLGLEVRWLHADLLDGVPDEFDAVLANLPYVAEGERALLAPEILRHEPRRGAVRGPDGLDGDPRAARAAGRARRGRAAWSRSRSARGQAPAVRRAVRARRASPRVERRARPRRDRARGRGRSAADALPRTGRALSADGRSAPAGVRRARAAWPCSPATPSTGSAATPSDERAARAPLRAQGAPADARRRGHVLLARASARRRCTELPDAERARAAGAAAGPA